MTTPDLKYYRDLLRLYYDGTATPQQEKELESMALEADMASLPDDLKTDTEMLRDIAGLGNDAATFAAGLDRIVAENPHQSTPGRRRMAPWIISAVSAAAVLAAVAFIGFRHDAQHHGNVKSGQTLIAEATPTETPAADVVPDTPQAEGLPAESSSEIPATPEVSAAPLRHRSTPETVKRPAATADETAGGTIEITDVETASEIVEKTMNLLARNLDTSRNSIEQTQNILQSTGQQINQYL